MKNARLWLCAAAAIALAACSTHKTSDGNQSYTLQTNQGAVSLGSDVDTSKLGAPVYPGAQLSGSTMSSSNAQGSNVVVGFKTSDDFDKVVAFYKQQLPQAKVNVMTPGSSGSVATFEIGTRDTAEHTTVLVGADPDGTGIMITHATKTGAAAASPEPAST
ncbi:MAG: hypothetical protein JO192_03405 [Candidatus Eremiobacteraeota bacterium]|nr:hypothetical protein [Candidatus Eremiobacteraeota bacterium]MBV8331757.1 hypothetical protein [Candidatus Eremiobacteraeota bacterium]MBV8721984.1 hypothetical protein [Candidatus Eremiobacteraeota bacterium]